MKLSTYSSIFHAWTILLVALWKFANGNEYIEWKITPRQMCAMKNLCLIFCFVWHKCEQKKEKMSANHSASITAYKGWAPLVTYYSCNIFITDFMVKNELVFIIPLSHLISVAFSVHYYSIFHKKYVHKVSHNFISTLFFLLYMTNWMAFIEAKSVKGCEYCAICIVHSPNRNLCA